MNLQHTHTHTHIYKHMYDFKMNLKRNTFKKDYEQLKTSKILKTKETRIKEFKK